MSQATTPADAPAADHAAQALAAILQPVSRMMIDHGLQLAQALELLKVALVNESVKRYAISDKQVSDARVALLTGVHRKDVRRLREESGQNKPAKSMVSIGSAVVARWISDPRFLHLDQSARALARTARQASPGEPDFATLVAEVSRDTSARTVLDELQRLGSVCLRDDGCVELVNPGFVPLGSAVEQFHFLAAGVADHFSASVSNLSPRREQPLMLDQSAFSQDLSDAQAELLHAQARRLWAEVLPKFLQNASMAEQRSVGQTGPARRVRFGVYFHEQVQETADLDAGVVVKKKSAKKGPST